MLEELHVTIEKIRTLSPQLNVATNEANAIVARVEKFLNEECSIGVSASVHVPHLHENLPQKRERETFLVYKRIDGKYRIAVEIGTSEPGREEVPYEYETTTSWSSCSRHVKLNTFEKLPDLLRHIAFEAGYLAIRASETTKAVQDILKAMGEK